MEFFMSVPKNVKILVTSRIALGWPGEMLVTLAGLLPEDGMKLFQQWSPHHKIDDENAKQLGNLVDGHSLSLRLLGSSFNNSGMSFNQFSDDIFNQPRDTKVAVKEKRH